MSDVTVTLAGFVGTTPRLFTSQNGTRFASFRIAATKRYLDRSRNEWVDGRTIWFTVKTWRQTAENVAASLRKGDAVTVTGRLAVDEWTAEDGPRTDLVVEATALGPDLVRGTAHFAHVSARRVADDERGGLKTGGASGEVASDAWAVGGGAGSVDQGADADPGDGTGVAELDAVDDVAAAAAGSADDDGVAYLEEDVLERERAGTPVGASA
ncbi:hypothetical protein GCM10025865_00550 [Paraoerskovia sediminicola]|uniref:Single-stranded DNA-binding protein n=1 Tax=Paraoerskovia sediminicola TaxID=1138587 RepID=A0ABN6XB53_9CELL|nr:single-stranded DNA-binding protein [Paraoerskovia sediminicola]BDZ40756.1 hypothetical protein GCM10025865_00550 [Paraoerskovia sediminicola]